VLIEYWHVVVTDVQGFQDANVPINDQRQADVEDHGLMQDKALNVYPARVAVVELGNDLTGFSTDCVDQDHICVQNTSVVRLKGAG
jgi:hypothetical protein